MAHPFAARHLSPHPVDVGLRTESAVADALVQRGFEVLQPIGVNHRYDLVVDLQGRFVRVQCKTGRLKAGAIVFSAASIRSNTRGATRRAYASSEVDVFAVVCPKVPGVFVVPIEDVPPSGHMSLRITPPANAQGRGIRWASTYRLDAAQQPATEA